MHCIHVYGRMAVGFLDPLGGGMKNRKQYPRWYYSEFFSGKMLFSVGVWPYGRYILQSPWRKGGKPSSIPGGICWLDLVVFVERADRANPKLVSARCFEGGGEKGARSFTHTPQAI